MRTIPILLLLCICNILHSQEILLTNSDIESNENKVIRSFEKFTKKPKKKRLKEKFLTDYNNSVSEHITRLEILYNKGQLEDKNWEGITNELMTLQYLNVLVKSSNATSFIDSKDYASQIDSISELATQALYNKGKETLQLEDNNFSHEIGYRFLKRAAQFDSDFKDVNTLMQKAIAKGTKKVFVAPVLYDNLGNYVEWGSNNSSMSSDYIRKNITNDISINVVGSHFVDNEFNADWIVESKWVSINISPERNNKYSVERSRSISENGESKTVYATVYYNERYKDVTGIFKVSIKSVRNDDIIVNENFTGTTFFSKIEATYTGDKRALTNEDNNVINDAKNTNFYNPEGYELTTKMYSDAIHNQLLNQIGSILNWNYQRKY